MAKKLKPVQKISKKELKEDKFITSLVQIQKYFQDNQANILKIGGGALLLILLSIFWVKSKSSANEKASNELGIAQLKMQQQAPAASEEEFNRIAEKYRGTDSGEEAKLMVAQMQMQEGHLDGAAASYDFILQHGSKDEFHYPAALAGKAACLESKSKFDEAASLYMKAASSKKGLFAAPQYYLDAARCYHEAGKIDLAGEQIRWVIKNYPKTTYAEDASKKLKEYGI